MKDALKGISDMSLREKAVMAPLIAMTLILGIYPSVVLDRIGPSVAALVENYHAAIPVDQVAEAESH